MWTLGSWQRTERRRHAGAWVDVEGLTGCVNGKVVEGSGGSGEGEGEYGSGCEGKKGEEGECCGGENHSDVADFLRCVGVATVWDRMATSDLFCFPGQVKRMV